MNTPNSKQMTRLFIEAMTVDPLFKQVHELIRLNARGRVVLCGGYVFRTIARQLYGFAERTPDIDVRAERLVHPLVKKAGWRTKKNHYGNPKFLGPDGLKMDLWASAWSIRKYLAETPLTIQSIVFDLGRKQLIGSTGMKALMTKTVAVHSATSAQLRSEKYDVPTRDYLEQKARALDFKPIHD